MRALLTGAAVGGLVAWLLARRWGQRARTRAALLEQGLRERGDDVTVALLLGGERLRAQIEAAAQEYAQAVAARTADEVLRTEYVADRWLESP